MEDDGVPPWVKKSAGILAFVILVLASLAAALFVFFALVRFGLWALGA